MILNDYRTGGFPLTRRSPIICSISDGTMEVAYSRFMLKKIIDRTKKSNKEIKECLGVWPGKKSTDCFIIDPKDYTALVPPEIHADIDSAEEIIVVCDENGVFEGIQYRPGSFAKDRTPVISKDYLLLDYIRYTGLRCGNVTGSINDIKI